ncbi:MAG: hypothetical protein KatS3mg106_331 [Gemmataceae bacterium]|jgi:hypothetical protein|nr:MAG: hypothetical protein KatS3mg106_331 [Gemmataceae bacterium]
MRGSAPEEGAPRAAPWIGEQPVKVVEGAMETITTIGFGLVLLVWLYGYSALLFRKPHSHG